jgi:hypothetical protein
LDLGIGFHLGDWPEFKRTGEKSLGDEPPLGLFRVGWEKELSPDVDWRAYFEHISSIQQPDSGVDVIMTDVHLKF